MTAVTLQSENIFMNVGSQNEMVEILWQKWNQIWGQNKKNIVVLYVIFSKLSASVFKCITVYSSATDSIFSWILTIWALI